jgi:hypothetical protein
MPQIPPVPEPPSPKSYKIELKVSVFVRTNHLSVEAIESAIHEAVKSRDGFAYISDINVEQV